MAPEDEAPGESICDPDTVSVLILEISKNTRDGRIQLDVGRDAWRDYFGGVEGAGKQVLVRYLDEAGTVGDLEPPHQLGSTKSTNFRFELGARRDMVHPPGGTRPRPIGVFVRAIDAVYRYMLLWPGESGYAELLAWLDAQEPNPGHFMRREPTTAAELKLAWPDCPLV